MKTVWIILIAIVCVIVIVGLAITLFLFSIYLAAKAPDKKDIRRAISRIIGQDIGKDFQILSLDYRFAHSDRPTSAVIQVPEEKFYRLLNNCENSADVKSESSVLVRKDIYGGEYCVLYQSVLFDKLEKLIYYRSVGC